MSEEFDIHRYLNGLSALYGIATRYRLPFSKMGWSSILKAIHDSESLEDFCLIVDLTGIYREELEGYAPSWVYITDDQSSVYNVYDDGLIFRVVYDSMKRVSAIVESSPYCYPTVYITSFADLSVLEDLEIKYLQSRTVYYASKEAFPNGDLQSFPLLSSSNSASRLKTMSVDEIYNVLGSTPS